MLNKNSIFIIILSSIPLFGMVTTVELKMCGPIDKPEIDTNHVINKAKLLTISQFGVLADTLETRIAKARKHVLAHLENDSMLLQFQAKESIEEFTKRICFIKIYNSVFIDTNIYSIYPNICEYKCAYLIAYSSYSSKFYKLYGFVNSELMTFLEDHRNGKHIGIPIPFLPEYLFEAVNRNLGFKMNVNEYFKYSFNNKYYKFKENKICDTCCNCRFHSFPPK